MISDFISATAFAVALAIGLVVGGGAVVGAGLVLVEMDDVAGVFVFAALWATIAVAEVEVD